MSEASSRSSDSVATHKQILSDVLDRRPSGTRLHTLISDFVRQVSKLIEDEPKKGRRR